MGVFTLQHFTWLYVPCFPHFCCLAALRLRLLGFPPEFTQEVFHLLGHFSEPNTTPFPLPLLFYLCLLFSKTLTRVPPLFHLLTSLPTIFSQLCNIFWRMLQAKICRCLVTREINALRVRIEKPPAVIGGPLVVIADPTHSPPLPPKFVLTPNPKRYQPLINIGDPSYRRRNRVPGSALSRCPVIKGRTDLGQLVKTSKGPAQIGIPPSSDRLGFSPNK